MSNKIETYRIGIAGEEPLLSMAVAHKAYDRFMKQFGYIPTQIRLSPDAFNDMRAMAERLAQITVDTFMGMEIKVDYDMKDRDWQVCKEETKVYAL